ncbi:MAG: methyltransferase domain-containing protein [Candidatus Methanomethylophilaceae archaeon]|nr:methyltransferase domain-containing protein [Candidatus Methanomethylophilaceae archaeon]
MVRKTESTVSVLDILRKDRFSEAEEHKRRRDELSKESRNWALRRDQYRERSKDAHREALEAREERDAINLRTKALKEQRDRIQAEGAEFKGKDKEAFERYREEARKVHEQLTAEAEKSRAANDKTVSLFEESKVDRILAEAAHKKFVECRRAADEEHRLFMETQKSARNMTGLTEETPVSIFACPVGEKGREVIAHMNEHHAPLSYWALGYLPEIDPKEILDIGCGGGMLIGKLHSKYPCARLHGVDISDESVKATRENNKDIGGLDVRKASVSDLPFDDGSFQLITAVETYFFWPDLPGDIMSAARCLAPGGVMMIVAETYLHPGLSEHHRQEIAEHRLNIIPNEDMLKLMDSAGMDARFQVLEENDWVVFIGVKRS